MRSTVTLDDVARKAGVSTKTVSRILNGEPNVSPFTYQKVNQAISELNYVPNTFARRLSSGKSMTIGMCIGWPLYSPFISILIDQALKESSQNNYTLALFSLEEGHTDHVIRAIRGKQVDGFLLDTPAAENETIKRQFNLLKVPYVVIHPTSKLGHSQASIVCIDDQAGGKQATSHLIQLGHRAIGCLSVSNISILQEERESGYREALQEAGIPFREDYVYRSSTTWGFDAGFAGAKELLTRHPELTAIFAVTDDVAMGALSAIWKMGLKIPGDVSIVGFDDTFQAGMTSPPLTTIHQPISEIARMAVQILIEKFDNPESQPVTIVLPTRLVRRFSCEPLKTNNRCDGA